MLEAIGTVAWLELVLVMVMVLMAIDLAWVLFANSARAFLKSPKAVSFTNKISASLMAGAAFWIAVKE